MNKEDYEFIQMKYGRVNCIFSTAKNNLNFDIKKEEGLNNLSLIKEWFNVAEVGYVKQIHSDKIIRYNHVLEEGDALITDEKKVAIGVLTADCVPILLFDEKKGVISAVHSGWKGTYDKIITKCINKMVRVYDCSTSSIKVIIGPHIGGCCYEFGQDIIEKFQTDENYKDIKVSKNGKLDLEKIIIKQLLQSGIECNNINSIDECTFCSSNYKFHSFRKQKEDSGRMFSFIFIDN